MLWLLLGEMFCSCSFRDYWFWDWITQKMSTCFAPIQLVTLCFNGLHGWEKFSAHHNCQLRSLNYDLRFCIICFSLPFTSTLAFAHWHAMLSTPKWAQNHVWAITLLWPKGSSSILRKWNEPSEWKHCFPQTQQTNKGSNRILVVKIKMKDPSDCLHLPIVHF